MPPTNALLSALKALRTDLYALRDLPRPRGRDWREDESHLREALEQRNRCRDRITQARQLLPTEAPRSWLEGTPADSAFSMLDDALESMDWCLRRTDAVNRGFKVPMDCDEQDQHDDPKDVEQWNRAQAMLKTRTDELSGILKLDAAREAADAKTKKPTDATAAEIGQQPSAAGILPSIRTLPLPNVAQELFSRAVSLVKQKPADFAPVGAWLDKHYSEATLRPLCERKYRRNFAYQLRSLRLNGTGNFELSTYKRRLALQEGRAREQLMQETIAEAHMRGYRLNGSQIVGRCYPNQYPDEKVVDESNYEMAWRSEDEQYRRRYWQIKTERKYGERFRENKAELSYRRRFQPLKPDQQEMKLDEDDHPEKPRWRLERAVGEIIEAEYPDPPEHVEHSRRIVGIAALLVCAEPLPVQGELGRWEWQSKPDATWEADPQNSNDTFWREASRPPTQGGPHKTPLHLLHARHEGREEVLFQRMPGEPRKLQHQWGELSHFRELLRVAVDELEPLPAVPIADLIDSEAVRMEQAAPAAVHSAGIANNKPNSAEDDPALIALTPNEQAIFDAITDAPMMGADVLAKLAREGITNVDESALSRACKRPPMKARGVRHRKGAGYYKIPV